MAATDASNTNIARQTSVCSNSVIVSIENIIEPTNPKSKPPTWPTICRMPMITASYIGKVISPAKAVHTGKKGTKIMPNITDIINTNSLLPVYIIMKKLASITKLPKQITLVISEYLRYLSSKTPKSKELKTPDIMNTPPKMLTSVDVKPSASKKGSITTPSAIKIESNIVKAINSMTNDLSLIAAPSNPQKFIGSGSYIAINDGGNYGRSLMIKMKRTQQTVTKIFCCHSS